MATVRIDIDLDKFDTDELVNELVHRDDLSDSDIMELKNIIGDNLMPPNLKKLNLIDKMKLELFEKNYQNKTLEEFERFFA